MLRLGFDSWMDQAVRAEKGQFWQFFADQVDFGLPRSGSVPRYRNGKLTIMLHVYTYNFLYFLALDFTLRFYLFDIPDNPDYW